MKHLNILLLMIVVTGCTAQKQVIDLNSLSSSQIIHNEPKSHESGKCYQKMKNELGSVDWYEVICHSRIKEYNLASKCLRKLGYVLVDDSTFKTADGNALIDFQQNEQLVYGALDEATLKMLLQKSNYYE